jgi:hypothetical protein
LRDVEASAEPPTSDDLSILLNEKMDPVLSGTTDTLRIECELGICLLTKKAVLIKDGNGLQVYGSAAESFWIPPWNGPELSMILIINHKLKSFTIT